MTAPKLLHPLLVITFLFLASVVCPSGYGQAPDLNNVSQTQEQVKAQEQVKSQEPVKDKEQPSSSTWGSRPDFLAKKFPWLNPEESPPIVLDNNLRRPFLFFRDAINQRWPLGRLFLIIMLSACLTKIFAKKMVAGAQERCRKNFLICLASAFIFTTILLSVSRLAFHTDALVPMALGCIAIVQISYIVGMGLGINIFANTFSDLICNRLGHNSKETRKTILARWFALVVTTVILTAIAAIPELGRLPRLGNRLVVLVAIIGLGGLISDMRTKSRNRESE